MIQGIKFWAGEEFVREKLYNYYNITKSFRNPKYLETYEDVVFYLEQAFETTPASDAYQTRTGNARLSVDFKVTLLAGGNIAVADHNGIVKGSNSFIEKLSILANRREVYSC